MVTIVTINLFITAIDAKYRGFDIMKYFLKDKTTQPLFNFIVVINGEFDYYLFEEFDDAVNKARQLSTDRNIVLIYEPYFNTQTREWRVQNTFRVIDHKIYYEKYGDIGLHLYFYINAGEWLNPNPEWPQE